MKLGIKVKDRHGEIGTIEEIFFTLVPIPKNKYYNSRKVIDAFLIKVSEKHFIYRKRDDIRFIR